jgi:hypothetical protein
VINQKTCSFQVNVQDLLILMVMLVPPFFGYQLALHLFLVGWVSVYSCFSKQTLGALFFGIAGLGFSYRFVPFLSVCLLMGGLIEPLFSRGALWMTVPLGYFFVCTTLDPSLTVKMIPLFFTLIVMALIPSFYRSFSRAPGTTCLSLGFFSKIKGRVNEKAVRWFSLFSPMDRCLIVIASITLVWFVCLALPLKGHHGSLPLRYKNTVLLFNFLALPFLWRTQGWFYFVGMVAINCVLGVRTGAIALIITGVAWIVARQWPKFFVVVTSCALLCGGWWAMYGVGMCIDSPWMIALGVQDHSFYERLVVWKYVSRIAEEHMWFGRGLCSLFFDLKTPLAYVYKGKAYTSTIVHPHNLFLEIRASFGIVGLSLFIGSLIEWMRRVEKRCSAEPFLHVLSMSGLVYLVVLWSGYLSFFKDPWILAWVALVVTWAYRFFMPLTLLSGEK